MSTLRRMAITCLVLPSLACATTTSTMDTEGEGPPSRILPYEVDRVYSAALSAVGLLSWELIHSEREAGLLQARTPRSFWTDGHQVMVRLQGAGEGTKVDMSSTTRAAVDWGKNRENIEKFFETLGELLSGLG